MGWEVRGARRYYTRTSWVRGGFVRTYVGAGAVGELAAAADAFRRANRRAASEAARAERQWLEEAGRPLRELGRLCGLLVQAALAKHGYHRHGGEWRRAMTTATEDAATAKGPAAADPLTDERVQQVLRRAMQGDQSVLPELGKVLDAHPSIWQRVGDLAAHAQDAWVNLAAGKDLLLKQALERKAAGMRGELAGPDAPPLERLLADRVVACWVQLHFADASYAQAKGTTLPQDAAAQRRQNAAQTRYTQAVRALAQLRRLLRPAVSPVDLAMRPFAEARPGAGRLSERPRLAPVGEAASN
jgi:hypothetical protein